jgi:hypothetical protein
MATITARADLMTPQGNIAQGEVVERHRFKLQWVPNSVRSFAETAIESEFHVDR